MKHARDDYNRIQDPSGIIPEDEPVFLLRGQDITAPETLEFWALQNMKRRGSVALITRALNQADEMRKWQSEHRSKIADLK